MTQDNKPYDQSDAYNVLRKQAEFALKTFPDIASDSSEIDQRALLHKLQVQQIELKMQNDELELSNAKRQSILDRYTNLFDFAPIGYLNLNFSGEVLLSNFTFSKLVGMGRAELQGYRLALLVSPADRLCV